MDEDATGCRVADSVFWHIGTQKWQKTWEGSAKIDVDMFQFAGGSPISIRYTMLYIFMMIYCARDTHTASAVADIYMYIYIHISIYTCDGLRM